MKPTPAEPPTPDPPPARSLTQRLGLATLLMVGSVFLSRLIGFAREMFIAAHQGATGGTDAYYAAFTLPDMLNYFLAGGTLSITFIPLFNGFLARDDEPGGWRLFSTISTAVGGLVLVAVVGGELFAEQLVPLLTPGFNDAQLALCVRMTRIVLPGLLCFTIGGLIQATLLCQERFGHVAMVPIVYNVGIIAGGLLLGPWLGVEGFAWGALAGALVGPLLLPLWAARRSITFRPNLDVGSEGFRTYLTLALPLMLGVTLISLDEWILRWFGSFHDPGTVSWLNNARRLMLVPFAIIGQATSQAALPFLSRLWSEGRYDEIATTLTRSLSALIFFAVVASAGMVALAEPITFVAFQRGAFTPADASGTAELLVFFSLGITAWSAQALIARGFYARQNTLEPMLIGTGVVLLALPVYAALDHGLGVRGLALASSVGIALNASIMLIIYRVRHAPIQLSALLVSAARGLGVGLPAAGLALVAIHLLQRLAHLAPEHGTLEALALLVLPGLLFLVIAFGVATALDAPELNAFTRRVKAKLGR